MIVTFSFSYLLNRTKQIKFPIVGEVSFILAKAFFRVSAMRQKGLLFFYFMHTPKILIWTKKKSKKNRPTDGTGTVRRQVKKKHKKGHVIMRSDQ